ncbi:MAG: M20 family metallopeptidase [Candidatus Omnitrophica bacterium]|jgi:succinyl-diaminopimelate desuccinylase|nr:M20 family metallopeptidase [Candidatus Omnitrophota bacterium]
MINKERLISTLQALIRIDSSNPGADERKIASWVAGYLKKIGVQCRQYSFAKNRPNVLASMGKSAGRALLITPHLDTVPPGCGWRSDPFGAQISGEKIFGLGSTDCKCNLAAALEAMHSLREERIPLSYKLVFAATADEESGSEHGLIPLINSGRLDVDAAVVLDADDFEVIVAQKGLLHVKICVQGRRAHGAYPWLGINAIDLMAEILSRIRAYRFKSVKKNRYLRPPTVNTGTIRGGDKVNIVAGWCECELDFRYLPGMPSDTIIKDVRNIVRRVAARAAVKIEAVQKPYVIDGSHPLVRSYMSALKASSIRARVHGSEGATVITFFQERSIPAIATGFGCKNRAHMVNEYVTLDNLYRGGQVLERFLRDFSF